MNKHPECKGCKYNTPKTQNGLGRLCNGSSQPRRCPEWAINEYLDHISPVYFEQSQVSAYMRGELGG